LLSQLAVQEAQSLGAHPLLLNSSLIKKSSVLLLPVNKGAALHDIENILTDMT
jgi:hypothetical protein